MNSQERHEIRYQRRKAKREKKRREKSEKCGTINEVFSYENLYKSGKKCFRGVRWKASTQNYERKILSNTYDIYEKIKKRNFKFSKPYTFYLNERGKIRKIQAQKINERILQRCLCDNVIVPIYDDYFIYDNAANRVGKGMDHTLNRVNCHMQRHFRKYGLNGWIVTCDFKDFFNTVPHNVVYNENNKRIFDKDVKAIANSCMGIYGKVGFGLGAHTSQIYTSIAISPLDHYIKDKLRVKLYGRYVDDFYFFTQTKEQAIEILKKIRIKVKELGLDLNEKKTNIQKFSKGFKFLKMKFICTSTGKVIRKINRKSVKRMRKKIKIFRQWIDEGKMTREQAWNAYASWKGHALRADAYKVTRKMDEFARTIL